MERPFQDRFPMRFIFFLCLFGAVPLCSAEEAVVFAQEKADTIEIRHGEQIVLVYHKKEVSPPDGADPIFRRSGFIHPVKTPSGAEVTGIHPDDHFHHTGLWHGWVHGSFDDRPFDSWNLAKGLGRVRYAETLSVEDGGFSVEQEHLQVHEGEESVVLREKFEIRARLVEGAYEIDYDVSQTNVGAHELRLPPFRYGGPIAYRSPPTWRVANSDYLSSEGKTRVDGHATRARWCSMWGPDSRAPAKTVSLTIMGHDANFDAPQRLRLWSAGNHGGALFFNFVPRQEKELLFKPNQTHSFRYRIVVADQRPDFAKLERRWARYIAQQP